MKRIWVCGASGMLGSHFTRLLRKKNIPHVANDYQQVDITQLDAVSSFVRAQKVTHIINCAAYTAVDKAETEMKQAYLINATGPHNLAIAARKHGARLIHFSTDYVFDGNGNRPYTEEDMCGPISAYGMSKWAGEVKLLDEHQKSCVIRTSWLYGLPGKNFVETMLRLMSEREQLKIVSDQVGRPTYCQDLVDTVMDLLDEEGIFHFANSSETSWFGFAKEILKQGRELEFPLKIKQIDAIPSSEYPTPAKRPNYSTLSTKKIETLLGKRPREWSLALRDYLEKYKNYQTKQTVD